MGARLKNNGVEKVYAAATAWVDRALRSDDSLFTPGVPIWSSRWLRELHGRFLDKSDEEGGKFLERLQRQLKDSPAQVYQLMGEALYFHFLIVSKQNSSGAQQSIDTVLGWSPSPIEISPDLVAGLKPGIANPGQCFHGYRPFQVGFIIEFVAQWKEIEPGERQRLLNDPWEFKRSVMGMPFRSFLLRNYQNTPQIQREALLHLAFPDTFEAIVSADHKQKIAKTFANLVNQPTEDVDRQLRQIRPALEAKFGTRDHSFYGPQIRHLWDGFVKRAKAYVDTGKLEIEEIEYKVEIGRQLTEAREAVFSGEGDWISLVKHGILGNLMNRFMLIRFRDWIDNSPQDALRALRTIWTEDDWTIGQRVHQFNSLFPAKATEISGAGTRMNVISVLLMALDVYQYPPFKLTVFDEAYERTGYTKPEQDADEAALYEHALGFLDRFIDEAAKRGLTLRHRLDAQSVVWAIKDTYEEPPEPSTEPWELEKRPPLINPWSPENIAALAKELLWEPVQLQQIVDDLQDKRQVIFYGPPGTGKTYVAREIAKKCRLNGGDFEIVQFHPSYSYEDFVEGFRPKLIGGQPGFELVHGPLRRIADKAKDNESATYILVIDELNRGNVAKVFGELYFLLEYRNEPVRLQYGRDGEGFSLPSNLWFICTMNTADRSIALMDAALRRRFYFAAFFPNEPPIRGLLRRWLNKQEQATLAADLIDQANQNLDRDAGIGPSYFMRPNQFLSEDSVRRIWERAVVPYVEEQCFGDEAKLQTFGFDALKRQIGGSELAVTPGESIAEQASNADSATN